MCDLEMRELTAEELAIIPEWATHYFIFDDGDILIESDKAMTWMVDGRLLSEQPNSFVDTDSVEIIRPFDIEKHELNCHLTKLENGSLGVNDCGWQIDKERAIAIAKALGVTAEDLK